MQKFRATLDFHPAEARQLLQCIDIHKSLHKNIYFEFTVYTYLDCIYTSYLDCIYTSYYVPEKSHNQHFQRSK